MDNKYTNDELSAMGKSLLMYKSHCLEAYQQFVLVMMRVTGKPQSYVENKIVEYSKLT